ncbi:MAG: amidohydrolase [Clostridiales bacterium]|jgi:5-methylthioadenosine/S-adenosylhomocysteine deaminase|nr:amidohydrolase [Clostridiales bacterium]
MDLLFKDITVIPMEGERVLRGACVGVDAGKICHVGGNDPKLSADRVIDGSDKLLLPGLYNCHTHTPMSLMRGYASDLKLQDWLFNYISPVEGRFAEGMAYTGALISVAEMLSNGVVSFSDMYFMLEGIAAAADEAGVKANLCNGMTAFSPEFDYFKDRSYMETAYILNNYHHRADGRIKADAGIHAEFTSFGRAWRQVVELAEEHGLIMHIHLSETLLEHENCKAKYGTTPAQTLNGYGVFDVRAIAAHCVWLEDSDIDIFREKSVTAVHNPVSNLKLSSGAAPIERLIKAGVNVALGTDGAASNNSLDPLADLKLASILQKCRAGDPTALPAYEALKLVTVNGAAAQGREKESGRIALGLDADLVMLDLHSPRQTAAIDPAASAVYSCTGRDVELTMCQGRILYEKGEYKTIDIEKAMFEAKRAVKKLGIL